MECIRCHYVYRDVTQFNHLTKPNTQTKTCLECRTHQNQMARKSNAKKNYELRLKHHYHKIAFRFQDQNCPDCGILIGHSTVKFYRKNGDFRRHLRLNRSIRSMEQDLENFDAVCQECYRMRKLRGIPPRHIQYQASD